MKVVVVSGLPGVGKTRYRKLNFPNTPVLDMADLRTDPSYGGWIESMERLYNGLINAVNHGEDVIVEGIFTPGTASYNKLVNFMRRNEIDFEIVRITEDDFSIILQRLLNDYEKDKDMERLIARAFLASKCRMEQK